MAKQGLWKEMESLLSDSLSAKITESVLLARQQFIGAPWRNC